MGSLHIVEEEHKKDYKNEREIEVEREGGSHTIIEDEKWHKSNNLGQTEETGEDRRKKRVTWFDQTTEGESEQDSSDEREISGDCVQIGTLGTVREYAGNGIAILDNDDEHDGELIRFEKDEEEQQHSNREEQNVQSYTKSEEESCGVNGNTSDDEEGIIHERKSEEEEKEVERKRGSEEIGKRVYVVVQDFEGTDEGELPLTEGDTLVLFEGHEDDDWWIGTLESTGQMGVFPKRCVVALAAV